LFNESLLEERGFDATVFYNSAALTALVGVSFNLLGGWLALRHSMGRMLGCAMFALTAALLAYAHLTNLAQVYAYAIVMGAAGGIVTVLFFSVWAKIFGQAHLGTIQGAAQLITVVSSALGPEFLARCQAMSGSYSTAFYLLAPVVALLGLGAWMIQLPDGTRDWNSMARVKPELAVQGVNS
jgi:MFS family permease